MVAAVAAAERGRPAVGDLHGSLIVPSGSVARGCLAWRAFMTKPLLTILALLTALLAGQSPCAQSAEAKPASADDSSTARAVQRGFAAIAKKVWPSVVTLRAYVREEPPPAAEAAAGGPAPAGWVQPAAGAEDDYPGFRLQAAC